MKSLVRYSTRLALALSICILAQPLMADTFEIVPANSLTQDFKLKVDIKAPGLFVVSRCEILNETNCVQIGRDSGYTKADFRKEIERLQKALKENQKKLDRAKNTRAVGRGVGIGAATAATCGFVALLSGDFGACIEAGTRIGAAVAVDGLVAEGKQAAILDSIDAQAMQRAEALLKKIEAADPGDVIMTDARIDLLARYIQVFMK